MGAPLERYAPQITQKSDLGKEFFLAVVLAHEREDRAFPDRIFGSVGAEAESIGEGA